jgi:hypothetical protein
MLIFINKSGAVAGFSGRKVVAPLQKHFRVVKAS